MTIGPYFKDEAVHFQLVYAGLMVRCSVSRVALLDKYGGINSPQGLISTYLTNQEAIHIKAEIALRQSGGRATMLTSGML